jgi:hypothetical protein
LISLIIKAEGCLKGIGSNLIMSGIIARELAKTGMRMNQKRHSYLQVHNLGKHLAFFILKRSITDNNLMESRGKAKNGAARRGLEGQ